MPLLPAGIAGKGTQGNFCRGGEVLYSVFFGGYHEHIKLKIHSPESLRSAVLSHVQHCDPVDHSLPGPYVHGISQASALEWFASSFSRESS